MDRPLPAVAKYALQYPFVQAEFGLMCPISVTDTSIHLIRKFARISAAVAQNQFKAEIDLARSLARQHQLCGGATDGVAMHADGAQAGRDQPAHFQITQTNDGDGLR
jgi:hypothetical protein